MKIFKYIKGLFMSWLGKLFHFTSKDKSSSSKKKLQIKAGYSNGRPYFDLSDRKTAKAFMDQADKFAKVKLS